MAHLELNARRMEAEGRMRSTPASTASTSGSDEKLTMVIDAGPVAPAEPVSSLAQ